MKTVLSTLTFVALSSAAYAGGHASGDAEAGEKEFRKCKACHMIQDAEGENIVRGGRTGPNLWGVVGRTAGTYDDFRYSSSMADAGEAGLVWDEETFVAYVQDPTGYLREYLDDNGARGKMSYRLRDAGDAADIWAYLASVSPEPEMDDAEQTN
ncbi:c-type cytochrome [Lutimaribacter sp. EGI FJ00015]|uniref:C-type cytochrome n=1 Tax=Lutimaribacter degradans TaxID=2945989 RepID=A0ACC5ZVE6_9RHOB|nr:c-type cytochrome [Lutimaribacter sp. EGI FJ00013]MCM2562047.1 c-type cytochrome [Lutimaribacter sp. EGI FJ00013]MCO0612921.1 c-type cytochrome [Lutimaribacter sp. EGI FJ00015]MCO0635879.1 c-type cytochrome [Lutimaribacter sp. EGI FJ00014]